MDKSSLYIPEIINNFNVYSKGNKLIGVTGEVTLAEMNAMTETINGAGLLGEYETIAVGHFSSAVQEITFRILNEDIFTLSNPMQEQELTLRASAQSTIKANVGISTTGMRIVFRGRPKTFTPGTVKQGAMMGAKLGLELMYTLYEIGGKRRLEIDKLNAVYKINDVDVLAAIRNQC